MSTPHPPLQIPHSTPKLTNSLNLSNLKENLPQPTHRPPKHLHGDYYWLNYSKAHLRRPKPERKVFKTGVDGSFQSKFVYSGRYGYGTDVSIGNPGEVTCVMKPKKTFLYQVLLKEELGIIHKDPET
jgi:hypothetical protein